MLNLKVTPGELELLVMLAQREIRIFYDRDEQVFGTFGEGPRRLINKPMVTRLLEKGFLQRPAWKTRDGVPRFPDNGHYPEITLTSVGQMKAEGRI